MYSTTIVLLATAVVLEQVGCMILCLFVFVVVDVFFLGGEDRPEVKVLVMVNSNKSYKTISFIYLFINTVIRTRQLPHEICFSDFWDSFSKCSHYSTPSTSFLYI